MQHLSHEDRVQVARIIMELLDGWQVSSADQIRLLAMPEGIKPRAMKKYREGTPLPDDPKVWERVEHLAGIDDALRTTYPRNAQMGEVWMNTVNSRFANRTPLACMLEEGLNGVVAVHVHLDCAYDWHEDQKKTDENSESE